MSYKQTLNLPQTDFEMRANLSKKEPTIIEYWNKIELYKKLQEKNKGQESFILFDGPYYANGNIHFGHALNKLLKDFVNKSKAMNGYYVTHVPGWDTHGLPIEQKVTELGLDRKSMSPIEFRSHCKKYAKKQIEIQKKQMLRLGLIGRFDKPYITFKKAYEARQLELFFAIYEKGLIHKGLKPIYWSPSSESALAESEIEYYDKKSPSIYVAFEISKGNDVVQVQDNLLIWTTTPWTIPGNGGVAVGQNIKYIKVQDQDKKRFIIAQDCLELIQKETKKYFEVIGEVALDKLVGLQYNHPLGLRVGKVVIGHHVDTESGTGLVHMAGAHGEDDFFICKDNDLEVVDYIDKKGYFKDDAPIAPGEFWLDANKTIGQALAKNNALVSLHFINHSYPYDWRTKQPVMYKATSQWFISIEPIKEEILAAINKINWIHDWAQVRLENMIKDRKDWCISRQRVWGVPIPIFYGENKKPILDPTLNQHIIKLFDQFGSNVWFEKETNELLPKGYSHPSAPNGKFTREKDIMDVWFDSGSSFHSMMKSNNINEPISLYLEGSDQYRGWFNVSSIAAVAFQGKAPCQSLLSHGFVLDGKGKKMSKSVGNVVDPLKIIADKGADIVRLWVASTKYFADVRISNQIIDQISEYYKGIRFKIRFALSNLYDFDYKQNATDKFSSYDKYVLMLIQMYNDDCVKWYHNYQFGEIFNETNNLLNKLSTEYFDYIKDITYIDKPNSLARRAVQTVLYHFVDVITRTLAPILSFTTEEAYKSFNKMDKKSSVLLEDLKVKEFIKFDQKLVDKVNKLIAVKTDIYKEIEKLRVAGTISKSSQCKVEAWLAPGLKEITTLENIDKFLMLASIEFSDEQRDLQDSTTGLFTISKTDAVACQRCRSYKDEIDNDICLDCKKIME